MVLLSNLAKALIQADYEVWGIGKSASDYEKYLQVDLLRIDNIRKSKKSLPSFDILIHTAALAHGQKPSKNKSLVSYNVKITENLLKYFEDKISHIIFTSSVSVYGEDKRFKAVTISDRLRPESTFMV